MIIIAFLALTSGSALAAVLTLVVLCVQSEDRQGSYPTRPRPGPPAPCAGSRACASARPSRPL